MFFFPLSLVMLGNKIGSQLEANLCLYANYVIFVKV